MKIFGIACRVDVHDPAIWGALHAAKQRWGLPDGLAYPFFRRDHETLQTVLRQTGLPVFEIDALKLASVQHLCLSHSQLARDKVGFSAVAEGCALAALGEGAVLAGPRLIAFSVTCACASSVEEPT
ncbi:hypothetical protein CGLAMM_04210 [Acetobacteraceae bacterium EV16G]|uniref:cobalamin biosynthesis protein n=1 Tax=Sorlinia euscelidii TaxID=3081148 RepID=UPI002F3913A2